VSIRTKAWKAAGTGNQQLLLPPPQRRLRVRKSKKKNGLAFGKHDTALLRCRNGLSDLVNGRFFHVTPRLVSIHQD